MRVNYILDVFPKISETFILNEILEIQKQGVDVFVFAFFCSEESKMHSQARNIKNLYYFTESKLHREIFAHCYLFFKSPYRYLKTWLLAINKKNEIMKLLLLKASAVVKVCSNNPDYIHAHFGQKSSSFALLTYLLTNVKFTFTTHRYDIFDCPPSNYRIKTECAKKHVTISEFNKKYIIDKFKVDKDKLQVLHCGVDFGKVKDYIKEIDQEIILSVGRLEIQKGFDNLIKACYGLEKKRINFKCYIIGEGSERVSLETLIKDLKLTNKVFLLGIKTQEEVFNLLSNGAIFVLASRSEGIPVALMEAMAHKIAVIGPKINGVSELIENGVSGFLVEPDNIDDLTEKMMFLIENQDLRNKFIVNAYDIVKESFNLKIETAKLIKIWEN